MQSISRKTKFVRSNIVGLGVTTTLLLLLTLDLSAQDQKQNDMAVTMAKYKSTPVIFELAKMTQSYDPSVAITAVQSLKQFTKVKSGRISGDALDALRDLEGKAKLWAKNYTHPSAPETISISKVNDGEFLELINLHLLNPKSVAFVDVRIFTDYDLRPLDRLSSLENLTIQDCHLFEGRGLEKIRLPNLKILHLNGSAFSQTLGITLKNFPKLRLVNLKDTKMTAIEVAKLRKKLGDQVKIAFE